MTKGLINRIASVLFGLCPFIGSQIAIFAHNNESKACITWYMELAIITVFSFFVHVATE